MQAVPAGVESAGSRANRQPVVGPRGLPSLSAAVPTLLLSDFLPLLAETPQAQLRRAQAQFEAEKRDRRDRTDFREWLASAFQAPCFADVVGQAERRMLPGTLAARREELQALLREQTAGNRSGVSVTPIGASAADDVPLREPAPVPQPTRAEPSMSAPAPAGVGPEARAGGVAAGAAMSVPTSSAGPGVDVSQALLAGLRSGVCGVGSEGGPAAGVTPGVVSPAGALAPVDGGVAAGRASGVPAGPAGGSGGQGVAREAAGMAAESGITARAVRATGQGQTTESSRASGANDANVERVLRVVLSRVGKERSVATLGLAPPELGKLRIRMEMHAERLALRIDAETEAARRLLAEQLDALRRGLEATGVQLERVEVRALEPPPDPRDPGTPGHPGTFGGDPSGANRRDAEDGGSAGAAGTESTPSEAAVAPVAPGDWESAAEPLVNIWA